MTGMVETARGTLEERQRDYMGHINVRAYTDLFEQAVWPFYALLGMPTSAFSAGEFHLAAVQQNISYKQELYPGDTVAVRCGVLELREKVLRFRQEMVNTETGAVCAICEFTVVCLDPALRKSRPFPPAVAERARELTIGA
jgi:acyl-CoA thioester hydrolase